MHLQPAMLFPSDLSNWLLIGVIGLIFFGRRLPEMGKSLGKGIVEFKKGLAGIDDDVTPQPLLSNRDSGANSTYPNPAQNAIPQGYKFDPYTGKPLNPEPAPPMRFDPYTGKPLDPSAQQTSNT